MRHVLLLAVLMASVALGTAVAQKSLRVKTADKYPARQKQGDLIVAVKAFVSQKDQKAAFGKVRPFQYGLAPVLLVLSNTGNNSYSLEKMRVRFITGDRESVEPLSSEDVLTFNPKGHQPSRQQVPGVPGLSRTRVPRGPLNRTQIRESVFVAPIVVPQSTASGFFYYFTGTDEQVADGALYISGIYDITNGKELFYFEIPLRK